MRRAGRAPAVGAARGLLRRAARSTLRVRWHRSREEAFAWRPQEDAATGKRYFYNKLTRETRWENPNDIGGGWAQLYDTSQKRIYYVHEGRGLTQWERPPPGELVGAAEIATDHAPAPSPTPPQPAAEYGSAEQARRLPGPPAGAAAAGAAGAAEGEDERFARLRALRANRDAVKEDVTEEVPKAPDEPAKSRRERMRAVLDVPEDDRSAAPERPLEEYAEKYFNLNRKGLLHGRTTVEKVLSWKAVRRLRRRIARATRRRLDRPCPRRAASGSDQDGHYEAFRRPERGRCADLPQHHRLHGRPVLQ